MTFSSACARLLAAFDKAKKDTEGRKRIRFFLK